MRNLTTSLGNRSYRHDPNAQTILDGRWEFARDHHRTIDPRLMDWTVDANEVPEPDGTDSAFDGDSCSHTDVCSTGVCQGTLAPASGCASAPRSLLLLRDDKSSARRLAWPWSDGTLAAPDLGDPASGGTSYVLCLFDASSGTPALRLRSSVAAGGTCSGKPCWSAAPAGFRYKNGATISPVRLTSGAGRASIQVHAKGAAPPSRGLPLAQDPWVTVQLSATTGACWESRFTSSTRNDGGRFTAIAP